MKEGEKVGAEKKKAMDDNKRAVIFSCDYIQA